MCFALTCLMPRHYNYRAQKRHWTCRTDITSQPTEQGCMGEARWQGLLRGMHVGMGRAGRHVRTCGPEEKASKWEWGLLGSIWNSRSYFNSCSVILIAESTKIDKASSHTTCVTFTSWQADLQETVVLQGEDREQWNSVGIYFWQENHLFWQVDLTSAVRVLLQNKERLHGTQILWLPKYHYFHEELS